MGQAARGARLNEIIAGRIKLSMRIPGRKYRKAYMDKGKPMMTERMEPNNGMKISLGSGDYGEFYINEFLDKRVQAGISTYTERIKVRANYKEINEFIRKAYPKGLLFGWGYDRSILDIGDAMMDVNSNHNITEIVIFATFEVVEEVKKTIFAEFEEMNVFVKWIYNEHMQYANVPIDKTMAPVEEMYPFLKGESLESYYKRFSNSKASILLLIGPPGTGKTSFIRGYLVNSSSSALVTYDSNILSKDSIFSEFIDGESDTLIVEDADTFLSSRKEGNDMMHKFLNVGDGLITVKGKKMIFSTNLPSIKDVDAALLRPGRCFDIVHFGEMTRAEAEVLVKKMNINFTFDEKRDKYTVAEIFSSVRNERKASRGMGFLG